MKRIPKVVSEIDKKINALKPGSSIELSRVGENKVLAERSGSGKNLVIFRESPTGFEVIKRELF